MKICFLNRDPSAYPGGDVLSINETIDALRPLGVEAKYLHGQWTPADLAPFDLVYVKHVNFGWSKFNFEQVWASGKPYIVQPVFYPRTDLGMSANEILRALEGAAAVIPYTWAEWRSLVETVGLDFTGVARIQCVPNGTNPRFWFADEGMRPLDVLCAAARGGKGTEEVGALCQRRGWSFRCATGLAHEEMPALYRTARVFVSASDCDQMSRTVGEALCSGCRVISSDKNLGNSYYGGLCVYPYGNAEALESLMEKALTDKEWDYSPNSSARLLTWDVVANLLRVVYQEALYEAHTALP